MYVISNSQPFDFLRRGFWKLYAVEAHDAMPPDSIWVAVALENTKTRTYMYAYEYAYAYTCIHAHMIILYVYYIIHIQTQSRYIREVHKGKWTAFKRTAGRRKLSAFCSRGLFLARRFYASINCKVLKRSYFTVNLRKLRHHYNGRGKSFQRIS